MIKKILNRAFVKLENCNLWVSMNYFVKRRFLITVFQIIAALYKKFQNVSSNFCLFDFASPLIVIFLNINKKNTEKAARKMYFVKITKILQYKVIVSFILFMINCI